VDVWRAPALEFEKPQQTDARYLAAQSCEECIQIALYILAIVGELSGIGQGQHSRELYIGI